MESWRRRSIPTACRRVVPRRGITPETLIEADNEAVISSLVVAGLGVALMREDLAKAGGICIWDGAVLATTPRFIWRAETGGDPVTCALLELVGDVWPEMP